MIYLSVPVPPSVNVAYRVAGKRRVATDCHVDWKMQAGHILARQLPADWKTLNFPVLVVCNLERGASVSREDVDNRVKLLLDLLVAEKVIADDSLIAGFAVAWAVPGTRTARLAVLQAAPVSLEFHPANSTAAAGGWIIPAALTEEEAA